MSDTYQHRPYVDKMDPAEREASAKRLFSEVEQAVADLHKALQARVDLICTEHREQITHELSSKVGMDCPDAERINKENIHCSILVTLMVNHIKAESKTPSRAIAMMGLVNSSISEHIAEFFSHPRLDIAMLRALIGPEEVENLMERLRDKVRGFKTTKH